MTDDEDDSTDENVPDSTNLIDVHYNYMAARENLQEFSGRVPRKRESENLQQDSNKPKVRKILCFQSPRARRLKVKWEKKEKTFTPNTFMNLTQDL
jgi:hypothetical protein